MDRISHLRGFAEAARLGSFSAAARKLDLTRDQVSKQIATLEAEVGSLLFARNTRSISLTSAGQVLAARAQIILGMVDEALSELRELNGTPRGALRVNAPMSFGQIYLAPLLPAFIAAYPQVQLRLELDDRFVDPARSGAEITVRIAHLPQQLDLVARPIATAPRLLVAAPDYLLRHGEPTHPLALAHHVCLPYSNAGSAVSWEFMLDEAVDSPSDHSVSVHVHGPLCSNSGDVLRTAALDGLGMTVLPAFLLRDDLGTGRLRRLLNGWSVTPDIGIFALYASSARTSPMVRAFVEFFEQRLRVELQSLT